MNDHSKQTEVRLNELARRAARTGEAQFSRFLEPSDFEAARQAAFDAGVQLELQGGFADAERRIAGFFIENQPESFPIRCLCAQWNARYAACGHRDLLGAMMGLGVIREAFGDILVDEDRAFLFVTEEIAGFVQANLESAGRAKLKLSEVNASDAALPEPKGRQMRVTVMSDRLDCVIAAGYDLSRAEVKRRIQSGDVKRNHMEELRPDVTVTAGDLLSVRGCGRMKILSLDGQTRKGRLAMQIFVYGK